MKTISAAALLGLMALALPASAGVGAKYGARDPVTCAVRNVPRSGAPSPAQAAQYFRCDSEGEDGNDNLYFFTDVKVQVASARPFNWASDGRSYQIDPHKPVYDIRGSFREHQCSAKNGSAYEHNPGHACNTGVAQNAEGNCYMSTFGDWHCHMSDIHLDLTTKNVAPPG